MASTSSSPPATRIKVAHGKDGGIDTLIISIGANNSLGVVTDLRVRWSGAGYDDLARKHEYTVWRPSHFSAELDLLVEQVKAIQAHHVIWGHGAACHCRPDRTRRGRQDAPRLPLLSPSLTGAAPT